MKGQVPGDAGDHAKQHEDGAEYSRVGRAGVEQDGLYAAPQRPDQPDADSRQRSPPRRAPPDERRHCGGAESRGETELAPAAPAHCPGMPSAGRPSFGPPIAESLGVDAQLPRHIGQAPPTRLLPHRLQLALAT